MPSAPDIGLLKKVHNNYLVLRSAWEAEGNGTRFNYVDWRDRIYFRLDVNVSAKKFHFYLREKTSIDIQYLYRLSYIMMCLSL